ncbi:hypothetical protein MWU65_16540 [Cellulophaga sp. F20128]|nr:hypothetical protein [Cellulophaga sp. F20128]MCK0158801.1 hypothetical protein [Cellulophaga sp. F20128]
MKTDKGILDEFGQLVAQECFDTTYGGFMDILNGNNKNPTKKKLFLFFKT